MFRDSARQIHAKADPADPYFLRISVACGKVHRSFPLFPYPVLTTRPRYRRSSVGARATSPPSSSSTTTTTRKK